MDDIISHGPEREPSRLARHAAAALILAMLIVLAVAAIGHLPRHHAGGPRHPASVVDSGPVQLAGLGAGAARMLNGDRPDHRPYSPGDHAGRCRHIPPGNRDFQLACRCHRGGLWPVPLPKSGA